ncbi:MAG: histidinol-phosphatase [Pseudoscardovia radai]|nr:histidinol-phosphatase [Pseudoscardovia radai]
MTATIYDTRSYRAELSTNPLFADLENALAMADRADAISAARFGALDLHVESKPDNTPVSDADRAVERAIRETIAERCPGDAVYGEELGKAESTGRRWILDPIDGTKNYVRGVPVWATLIGLQVGDEIVAGVVSAPALHNRWFAVKGGGAYMGAGVDDAVRIHVSHVAKIEDASMSLSSLTGWKERGDRQQLLDLTDSMWRLRGFGDFWQYMLVAQGAVDAAAEPELDLYDMGALVPIVTEAGGMFTDLDGNPGPWGGCGLATNGLLHEEILAALR